VNVAIIVDGLIAGGAERQAILTASEVVRRGQRAHLVVCNPGNDYADFCETVGVEVVHIDARGPLRVGRLIAIARHLRRRRVDVAHAFKGSPSTYGRLAARLAGVPCIFGGYRAILSPAWPFRLVNRALSWGTAGWIVNSEHVKQTVMADYGVAAKGVHVVPNAVHPSTYESDRTREEARSALGVSGGAIVITMIANLRREKNHAMLLRVARRLIDDGLHIVVLLAGAGPEREVLEKVIVQMDLEARVRLLGHVARTGDLLRATDIVVLTTVSEGLPNALLEAGAAGLPAVSTENGGAAEVILPGRTGYLVPVNDHAAMVARLEELARDPGRRTAMGAAAREHVLARFSPAALGDRILAVYEAGLATARR
jgi:glycosyltransferase involved in cell wall biosynthesis